MSLYLHLRVASRDALAVHRRVASALSRSFLVSLLPGLESGQMRFVVDTAAERRTGNRGESTPSPRVEVVIRRGWGPTVELLILLHSQRRRCDARVAMHAEAVSGVIMRCLESLQSGAAGIDGHWIAPCGWYLHVDGNSFYFERSFREVHCSCAASWQESCAGELIVDDSLLAFRYANRHVWWRASAADAGAGVHESGCRLGVVVVSQPPPAIEWLVVEINDSHSMSLSAPTARVALATFRRIGTSPTSARARAGDGPWMLHDDPW